MDFIVLGGPRCGTTMSVHYLNRQQNIKCHSEIFNPKRYSKKITRNKDIINWETPLEVIGKLDALNVENKKHGFKLLFSHTKNLKRDDNFFPEDYIKENNIKVILINRKNNFLRYLSLQKARKLQCFAISKRKLRENPNIVKETNIKINFDFATYQRETNFHNTCLNLYKDFFIKNNINFYEVCYEDLLETNRTVHYKNMVKLIQGTDENFIEVNEVETIKQNIYTVEEQLLNFSEVEFILKDDPWFQESIK